MQINETRGLGFDDWDLEFYEKLFKEKLGRDPTDVELFDMGQVGVLQYCCRAEEEGQPVTTTGYSATASRPCRLCRFV